MCEQGLLPFPETDSDIVLDDTVILADSMAIAGFRIGPTVKGEVFDDGTVSFHSDQEVDVDNSDWPHDLSPIQIVDVIKQAHTLKVGIAEEA